MEGGRGWKGREADRGLKGLNNSDKSIRLV